MSPQQPAVEAPCPQCQREQSPIRLALRRIGKILAWPLIILVRGYQLFISPLTPPSCRYYPSCSAYALTAVQRYGPFKGTWLAVRRVGRCHPWAPGGVDYVPERPHTCSASQPHTPQTADSPSRSAATTDKDRR
ncbi:MAG: membrane protein insertion efficiency factor YidD [Actinomycetales bacterium]|nr:membrane protein insertion efficiency factor YidD [Actinomycetales bacterium]